MAVMPALVLGDLAAGLVAADLLVDGVEQLLAGGSTREAGSAVFHAAEQALVHDSFGGSAEGDAHAVEGADDSGGFFAQVLDGWLIGEVIAALDGVNDVLPDGVVLTLDVEDGVDAALGAGRV
jgi:hypothetical protein